MICSEKANTRQLRHSDRIFAYILWKIYFIPWLYGWKIPLHAGNLFQLCKCRGKELIENNLLQIQSVRNLFSYAKRWGIVSWWMFGRHQGIWLECFHRIIFHPIGIHRNKFCWYWIYWSNFAHMTSIECVKKTFLLLLYERGYDTQRSIS